MTSINKLMGFYELKESGLPSIPWEKFDEKMNLDPKLLWTVRTAVIQGEDLNLPRKIGVSAKEAYEFAQKQNSILGDKGLVVIYPYFIAEKSGTLEVQSDKQIIEGVYKDLWNFVTYNKRDVTIIRSYNDTYINGEESFFDKLELAELDKQVIKIKKKFRSSLITNKSILLEWSFAYNTDINHKKIGQKYLVFYEIREI